MIISPDYFFSQTSVVENFKEHLSILQNKRILFSAKFGAGKSTFLNNYFEEFKDEFIVLKLYPVNYSVATNEDVFELIKYDLFFELLAKYADVLNIENEDFSPLLVAQSFLLHDLKFYPFLKALFKATVPEGDKAIEVVDAAKDIYQRFKDYQKLINADEKKVIDDYLKWSLKRKGSIYEKDDVTALITELILRLKDAKADKPIILIIDDLDRLDPEHVFRLFNIFSAHYDYRTDTNKFSLDKVIFVCDYNNIQTMYNHRYGVGVDFEGYINKFYSVKVFNYDNNLQVREQLFSFLDTKPQNYSDPYKLYSAFNRENYIVKNLVGIFIELLNNQQLTLRQLGQFKEYDLPKNNLNIDNTDYKASNFYFLTLIHLLLKVIPFNMLTTYFQKLENNFDEATIEVLRMRNQAYYRWIINHSLIFIADTDKIFSYSNGEHFEVIIDHAIFKCTTSRPSNLNYSLVEFNTEKDQLINPFKFMNEALRRCIKMGYIN